MKKTVVFGASPNPNRYSYYAASLLEETPHEYILLGKRNGVVEGHEIITEWPEHIKDLDTITMYMGAKNQAPYYNYILGLKPKRIIFNPGAENPELAELAQQNGIVVEESCTLVLLRTGQY